MNQNSLRLLAGLGLGLVALSTIALTLLLQYPGTSLIPLVYRSTTWLLVALVLSISVAVIAIAKRTKSISK